MDTIKDIISNYKYNYNISEYISNLEQIADTSVYLNSSLILLGTHANAIKFCDLVLLLAKNNINDENLIKNIISQPYNVDKSNIENTFKYGLFTMSLYLKLQLKSDI
jgi:hypothetical protein